jgi:hypothetical protein
MSLSTRLRTIGAKSLTIFGFGFHNNITFDDKVLQGWAFRNEQLRQSHGADTSRPESLECFGIFTPRLDEDIQSRTALDVN